MKSLQLVLALGVAVAAGALGCTWVQKQHPTVEPAPETAATAVKPEHSLAVLTCASFMQRMAFDSGKRLPDQAALDFCSDLEASPDVNPAPPTTPVHTTPEVI